MDFSYGKSVMKKRKLLTSVRKQLKNRQLLQHAFFHHYTIFKTHK